MINSVGLVSFCPLESLDAFWWDLVSCILNYCFCAFFLMLHEVS